LVRFFSMSGQSDRRRPTYLESDVFRSDAINGEVADGLADPADNREPVARRGGRDQRP
jgi:hypothetical protein